MMMRNNNHETVDERRIRRLNYKPLAGGPIAYWMSRDQRADDNWALLYARELALTAKEPLTVVFNLLPEYLGATLRHYRFMLNGLQELQAKLARLNIGFYLLAGKPEEELPRFCREHGTGALVTDFSPLRHNSRWKTKVAARVSVACFEVDAHNIVPCWAASPKQEYAAYTLRPKLHKLLPEFLTDFPLLHVHPHGRAEKPSPAPWGKAEKFLKMDREVVEISRFRPGEGAAYEAVDFFLSHGLPRYHAERNDPTREGQSNLSPYLHFGQLSAQRLAHEVRLAGEEGGKVDAFLEELVVRRELSDNFCFYNDHYDGVEGFPRWARESLEKHWADPREYQYTVDDFESSHTHDPLWNAAQEEMVLTGKMHGYLRMYWAKKILEWTESPRQAMETAIYLNDKYSLDGRDPNGYAGIAWSVGGVHDRAWAERPIFGKIRYMSYGGSKSKFNIKSYIEKVASYAGQEQ